MKYLFMETIQRIPQILETANMVFNSLKTI